MRNTLRLLSTATAFTLMGGYATLTAGATTDTIPCDPATGCIPSPVVSPPAILPSPAVTPAAPEAPPPTAIPVTPTRQPPDPVRKIRVTVRKNDPDSFQGFTLNLAWAGGANATSFELRVEKVAFAALTPGDSAKKPGQYMQVKRGEWIDTQVATPRRWKVTVPKATAFYRVQVRGANRWGSGPLAEQYLLIAKDNEKGIVFK